MSVRRQTDREGPRVGARRSTDASSPDRQLSALLFAMLGGAAAWAVQFLVGYITSEGACVALAAGSGAGAGAVGAGGASVAGLAPTVIAVVVVSLVAFGVALAAASAGRRVWLAERDVAGGSRGFVGLAGMLLSGVFALLIVVQVAPLVLAGGCA